MDIVKQIKKEEAEYNEIIQQINILNEKRLQISGRISMLLELKSRENGSDKQKDLSKMQKGRKKDI